VYTFNAATSGYVKVISPGWSVLRPDAFVSTVPDHSYVFNIAIYQSTTVSGVVYQDLNRNGMRDNDEPPVADTLMYAPFSYSPPVQTPFIFTGQVTYGGHCGLGVVTSCVVPPGGSIIDRPTRQIYTQTAADGSFTLADMPITNPTLWLDPKKFVRTSDTAVNDEIGVLPIRPNGYGVAEVRGRVFDDVNNNGKFDAGENLLSGVILSAGERRNDYLGIYGQYAQSGGTSDANGNFTLTGLRQGTYGMKIMAGPLPMDSEMIDFTLDALEVKTIDVPAHPYCVMSGTIVEHWGNPVSQPLTVYIDQNNNARLDTGELSTESFYGNYYFNHVPEGTYTVRIANTNISINSALPTGVAHHDQAIQNPPIEIDFTVTVQVYLDANANGRKDAFEP